MIGSLVCGGRVERLHVKVKPTREGWLSAWRRTVRLTREVNRERKGKTAASACCPTDKWSEVSVVTRESSRNCGMTRATVSSTAVFSTHITSVAIGDVVVAAAAVDAVVDVAMLLLRCR